MSAAPTSPHRAKSGPAALECPTATSRRWFLGIVDGRQRESFGRRTRTTVFAESALHRLLQPAWAPRHA
jgi:hypothetical protein